MKWFRRSSARKKKFPVAPPEVFVLGSDIVSLSSLVLEGLSDGNYFVNDKLFVAEEAHVRGSIVSGGAVIRGRVSGGLIRCLGELTIGASAVVDADIEASLVEIEPGAVINGSLRVVHVEVLPELVEKIEKAKRIRKTGVTADEATQADPVKPVKLPSPEVARKPVSEARRPEIRQENNETVGNWW